MIAQLATLSEKAGPTPFHKLLRRLDDKGRLLRVYTQNIDALEAKAGLTFGLPRDTIKPRSRVKSAKAKGKEVATPVEALGQLSLSSEDQPSCPITPTHTTEWSSRAPEDGPRAGPSTQTPLTASQSFSANQTHSETPRCIPLHGTLQTMHCQACTNSFPLSEHLSALIAGTPPDCPECTAMETTRSLVGKRPRGVGKLRPSVVLYNEEHKDGEGVGDVAEKDLIGRRGKGGGGADLLVVVGTSLRVPGTKRIVREFSKAVKARAEASREAAKERAEERERALRAQLPTPNVTPTSTPSPRRSPPADDSSNITPPPITSIYLNLDFPVPTREWDNVFDVWIQGDAQHFAETVRLEMEREEKERIELEEKKKRREEERAERAERLEREREERARLLEEKEKIKKTKVNGKQQAGVAPSLSDTEGSSLRKRQRSKGSQIPSGSSTGEESSPKLSKKATTKNAHKRPAQQRRVRLIVFDKGCPDHGECTNEENRDSDDCISPTASEPFGASVDPISEQRSVRERKKVSGREDIPDGCFIDQMTHRRHHPQLSRHPSTPPNDINYPEHSPDLPAYRDPLDAMLPSQIRISNAREEPFVTPRPTHSRRDSSDYPTPSTHSVLRFRLCTPVDRDERREHSIGSDFERKDARTNRRGIIRQDECTTSSHTWYLRNGASAEEPSVNGSIRAGHTYVHGYSHTSHSALRQHGPCDASYMSHHAEYARNGIRHTQANTYTSSNSHHHSHNRSHSRSIGNHPHHVPLTPISPPLRANFDDEDMEIDIINIDDDYDAVQHSSPMVGTIPVRARDRQNRFGPPGSDFRHDHDDVQNTPNAPRAVRYRRRSSRSLSPGKVSRVYQPYTSERGAVGTRTSPHTTSSNDDHYCSSKADRSPIGGYCAPSHHHSSNDSKAGGSALTPPRPRRQSPDKEANTHEYVVTQLTKYGHGDDLRRLPKLHDTPRTRISVKSLLSPVTVDVGS